MDTVEKVREAYRRELAVPPSRGAGDRAWLAAISAYESALKEKGLVIVPREPTAEMEATGNEGWLEEKTAGYIYRSMIDAAPQHPRPESP